MPPKSDEEKAKADRIKALRKKQRELEKLKAPVLPKTIVHAPKAASSFQASKNIEEEHNIREFFKNIILNTEDDEEAEKEMIEFSKKPGWGRKAQFEEIIIALPRKLYKDLAKKHIEQRKILKSFWEEDYKKTVKKDILEKRKKQEEIDDFENLKIPEKVVPKVLTKPAISDKKKGWVEELDYEGKIIPKPEPVKKPVKIMNEKLIILPYEDCLKHSKNAPWLKDINLIYITDPPDSDEIKNIMISRKSESIDIEGEKWWLIDEKFNVMLCKSKRIWDNNSIIAIHPDGRQPLRMRLGYIDKTGKFIPQTEEIFKMERTFINKLKSDRGQKMKQMLNSPITEEVKKFARSILSDNFRRVGGGETYTNPENPDSWIFSAVKVMVSTSTNTKNLFEKLASIIVYLQDERSVFYERVKEVFYMPSILATLTREEKRPEIFDNPEEDYDNANRIMDEMEQAFVKRLIEVLYNSMNPTENIPSNPQRTIKQLVPKNPWKSICENKTFVGEANASDVVYYTEDGKVYCLLISEIYAQIAKKIHPINPITKNMLDEKFLLRFRELYDNKFIFGVSKIEDQTPPISVPTKIISPIAPKSNPKKHIAAGLLDMIRENIKGCEKELEEEIDGKCKSLNDDEGKHDDNDDNDDDEKDDDDKDDDEKDDNDKDDDDKDDEKDDEKEDVKSKDVKSNDDKKDDKKDDEKEDEFSDSLSDFDEDFKDSLSEFGESESEDLSPKSTKTECTTCKKHVNPKDKKIYKSMIEGKDSKFICVYFCDLNCFKKMNDWPCHKKIKKKK
jgi:hypothetical protein